MCFVLVYKSTKIVNFAQGEFLLIGAWVCWAALVYLKLPFFLGFLLSMCFMAAFGVLLQMIVLRPMIGEPIISVDHDYYWSVDFLPVADEMDFRRIAAELPAGI